MQDRAFPGERDIPSVVVSPDPPGGQTLQAAASLPYAISLRSMSVASRCPDSCTGYRVRVLFYDGNYRKMYGNLWESPRLPLEEPQEISPGAVLQLDQMLCFHTGVVDTACKLVVELVLDTSGTDLLADCAPKNSAEFSAGFALLPVFGVKLKNYGSGRAAEHHVFPGTPRFLHYSSAVPVGSVSAGGRLVASVTTHMDMVPHTTRMRENEIFSMLGSMPTLSTAAFAASNLAETCTVTLSDLSFRMPPPQAGSAAENSTLSFGEGMLKCLSMVTEDSAWLSSTGIEAAHAYCGVYDGRRYTAPRVHVALKKSDDETGYILLNEAPVVIFRVPMNNPEATIVISLYATVGSGQSTTTVLIGWVSLPCQTGLAPQTLSCDTSLNRGPEPAPCSGVTISWGDVVGLSCTMDVGEATPVSTAVPGPPADAVQAGVVPTDERAETAGVVVTVPLADANTQALLHEQQLQIASLKQLLETPVEHSLSKPDEEPDSLPKRSANEVATSTSTAPWKLEQYDAMRTEVKRLSEELARRSVVEDQLKIKMDAAEGSNQQLQRDLAAQERSLSVENSVSAAASVKPLVSVETTRDEMLQLIENELGDYRVTPMQPVARATRAEIVDAGVPDIIETNRSGAGGSIGEPVDLALEENDALQESEIVVHATGLTPAANWTTTRLYFVVQFYHFAPAVSEVVTVRPASEGHAPGQEGIAHNFANSDSESQTDRDGNPIGVKLTFTVKCRAARDDTAGAPPESRRLASYLCSGALHLEAWDADSLLPLGSLRASLAGLLRQGRPSVQSSVELDLRSFNFTAANDGGRKSATLQLSVSNNGKMSRNAADDLVQAVREEGNVTVGPVVSGVVPKVTLQGRSRHRQRATLFVSTAPSDKSGSALVPTAVSEDERKLARLHRLTAAQIAQGKEVTGPGNVVVERWEHLQQMDREREQTRDSRIAKSLHTSITRKLRLLTRFGEVGFFGSSLPVVCVARSAEPFLPWD